MNSDDANTIALAAECLQADNGAPIGKRDCELAFLAGLILARGDGQTYTGAEIGMAVTQAVQRLKAGGK